MKAMTDDNEKGGALFLVLPPSWKERHIFLYLWMYLDVKRVYIHPYLEKLVTSFFWMEGIVYLPRWVTNG